MPKKVECIRLNYYKEGNILVTQAQAVAMAGILMPEFKNANEWLSEGSQKLGEQIDKQFLQMEYITNLTLATTLVPSLIFMKLTE